MPEPRPLTESPTSSIVRLPYVTDCDQEEVLSCIMAARDDLPEMRLQVSAREARRAERQIARGIGPLTHGDALSLIVPVIETLFDGDCVIRPPFHAQLIVLCQFPSIPQSMVTQVAFGRRVGEEQLLKLERLAAQARQRASSIDEYVAELHVGNAMPHDRLVRLFLGEAKFTPLGERMRVAIGFLRTTAALAVEPLRPPILCAIAWLLWAQGKRALALNYVAEALRIDPQHLTAYGLDVHFRAHLPAWIE